MNLLQNRIFLHVTVLLLIFSGCSSDKIELPEHARELENLTVYPLDTEPVSEIQLIREESFGDTEEALIGSLGDIAVDERGRVFIADGQQSTILVFHADGSYETAIGREGRGPGEFLNVSSLGMYEDQLYAYDNMQQRISVISLDSLTLSQMITLNTDDQSLPQELENSSPAAQFFIRDHYSILMKYWERPQPDEVGFDRYYYIIMQGEIISDLILKKRGMELLITSEEGRITNLMLPIFYQDSKVAASESGLIFSAWTEDFLIRIHDEEGQYLRSFYYPYPQRRINRQDILNQYQGLPQQLYRNEELPETWPSVHDMVLDDEQRLWVATISDSDEHYTWWVLNENGELLAKFDWPGQRLRRLADENTIEIIKHGYVYIREVNEESGQQQIVRYRIELEEV